MGYGGNRANAGQVTRLSADNGIDGIINEDPLGLDTIYLQAKRWQDPVGEGPVRDFIGALVIKGVKKACFSPPATSLPQPVPQCKPTSPTKKSFSSTVLAWPG